jgi:uncharacterized LabA/DUF88 family protein
MYRVAVFIDNGYMRSLLKSYLNETRIDYRKFVEWISRGDDLFRAYVYDCLPYQSEKPTPEEREKMSRMQAFVRALECLDRFTVRQGRLECRGTKDEPVFVQKRVDLQLGLDIATLALGHRVDIIAVVSGDSDLIPAINFVKDRGVLVRLVHGPKRTYHDELWLLADERLEITHEVINCVALK